MADERETAPSWPRTHQYHRTSSFFLRPGVLIVVAPLFALTLLFLLPPLLSSSARILRLTLVKNSWDALNLLLVLFAILCGILCRNHGANKEEESEKPNQQTTPKWFEYPTRLDEYTDHGISDSVGSSGSTAAIGRLRSSSSYPDLRQESWVSDDGWRFSDDYELNNRRRADPYRRRTQRSSVADSDFKTIPVDTYNVRRQPESRSPPPPPPPKQPPSPPPPPPSEPPSPPPPPPVYKQKTKRTFRAVPEKPKEPKSEHKPIIETKTTRPPPPPAPPPPPPQPSEQKSKRSDRKRSGGAKDIATAIASIYHHRSSERKKKKPKNKYNYDNAISSSSAPPSSSTLPPPPPPPPPASVLHQLFSYKKTSKSKRFNSISISDHTPPPPPPPPPPTKQASRPPLPMSRFYEREDSLGSSGGRSPLIPMPPPPPPPPFQMQKLKFTVHGDYVRVPSSSHGVSPDSEIIEVSSKEWTAAIEGGGDRDGSVSVFCPSPDVNTKADTFIARFRAGLRLEKLNSIKDNKVNESSGPRPDPEQGPI